MRLFFAALFALAAIQLYADGDPLDQAVAELRQSGVELDLDNMIRPGRERAAAVGVERLSDMTTSLHGMIPDKQIAFMHEYSAEQRQEAQKRYDQTQPERQYLANLIANGEIFPIDWQIPPLYRTLLPHLSSSRRMALFAAASFRVRATEGDTEGAMREWRFAGELADRLRREPIVLSFAVAAAIDNIRMRALDTLAETGMLTVFSDAELRELLDLFRDETALRASYKLALNGEIVMLLTEFRHMNLEHAEIFLTGDVSAEAPQDPEAAQQMLTLLISEQGRRDLAALIRCIGRQISLADRDCSEFEDAGDLETPDTPGWWQASAALDAITVPSRSFAQYRVSAAGMALELYRRTYGRLPETLAQLVPEFLPAVPRDPFDGAELRYFIGEFPVPWQSADGESVRTLHGARVHSVGPDLTDDGGLRDKNARRLDTVFFLAVPEP